MAILPIRWVQSESISFRDYAICCGFNLNSLVWSDLTGEQQKFIEKKCAEWIMEVLDECFLEEHGIPLEDVSKGVYAITLAEGVCVGYPKGQSPLIYIGRGQVRKRIRAHLKKWIVHFSESLQDIKITFWMSQILRNGSPNAYVDFEHDLIKDFRRQFGALPIFNRINGTAHSRRHQYGASSQKPFKLTAKMKRGWAISPMIRNPRRWKKLGMTTLKLHR